MSGNRNGAAMRLTAVVWLALIANWSYPAAAQTGKPFALECEALSTPLGMDAPHPLLSWKLQDTRDGAKQTAYQVQVAADRKSLESGKADVWDSGRVVSEQSIGVVYRGPSLSPSKRYYWRVKLWDAAGKEYPQSETSWWETGLLIQDAWNAPWIGYETPEESAVRHAIPRSESRPSK